jgi:hypothetical protein
MNTSSLSATLGPSFARGRGKRHRAIVAL